jgi:pimeloyl-ACP methyl ester carboxylesterase
MDTTDQAERDAGCALDAGGVELWVQTFGNAEHPAILLIGGAHCPMDLWEDDFCRALVADGRFVIRYDHRDTGQSVAYPPGAPGYGFDDLVRDALGVLDATGIRQAHLVGISMGGGIAQRVALDHPDRVASITLIATSPGLRPATMPAQDLPGMSPALLQQFMQPSEQPDWTNRSAVIEAQVTSQRRLAGPGAFDEPRVRRLAGRIVDRTADVAAMQINHGLIEPGESYRARLREITAPTLVIHGTADPLFPHGHAEALVREIPGAELLTLDGVGHQVPPEPAWGVVVPALLAHSARTA